MCLLVPGLLIYCSRRGLAVYNGYVLSQFTRHFPDGLILVHIAFVLGAERPCSIAIRTYYGVRKRGIPAALGIATFSDFPRPVRLGCGESASGSRAAISNVATSLGAQWKHRIDISGECLVQIIRFFLDIGDSRRCGGAFPRPYGV